MKKIAMFICFIIILSVTLTSCNDKSPSLLTESQPAGSMLASSGTVKILAPELTRENVRGYCLEKSKEGWDGISVVFTEGQIPVVKLQREVQWDGTSPMKSGVLYRFSNKAKYLEADAISEKHYRSLLNREQSTAGKVKSRVNAQLASGGWWAEAGWAQVGATRIQMYSETGNPPLIGEIMTHKLQSHKREPWDNWVVSHEYFSDYQAHFAYQYHFHSYDAPWTLFEADGSVWDDAVEKESDHSYVWLQLP